MISLEYSLVVISHSVESRQAQDIPVDSDLNMLARPEFEKALRMPSVMVQHTSGLAPLARPESGLEDSDLEDDSAYRVSRSWANFTLSTVQQSSESLNTPRPAATTENFTSRNSTNNCLNSSLSALHDGPPPPKPPRTFATEIFEGRPIVRIKAPPKPPRTFDHDPRATCNYSSLDWNFPRPKDEAAHICSQNSWNCSRDAHTSQQSCDDSCAALNSSQNSWNASCEGEYTPENDVLPPYSSHKRYRLLADSSGSDKRDEYKTFPAISLGADSREGGISGKLEAWFSDSVVNIDLEESMLLGSVKPRRGRRRRQNVAATSQASASSTPSLTKSLLETTL